RQRVAEALAAIFDIGVPQVRKVWLLRPRRRRGWLHRPAPDPLPLPAVADPIETTLTTLRRLVQDPARGVRAAALAALAKLGSAAGPAVTEIATLVNDEDAGIRQQTAEALGQIEGQPETSVAALLHLLEDAHQPVRPAALRALAHFGEDVPAGG